MKSLLLIVALLIGAGCAPLTQQSADEDFIRSHPERFVLITLHNDPGEPSIRAGSSPREYGPAMQYATAPRTRATAREIETDYNLIPVREWPIAQLSVHCIVYRLPGDAPQADVLNRLRSDVRVESAQPLNSFSTLGNEYNDRYAGLQHSLVTLGVPQAHALSRGKGVSIAVVDTAVDTKHQDFAGSQISTRDFTGRREPAAAHGTAVAGIIAATDDNGLGIVGVAPGAQVHALTACWSSATNANRAVCDSFTLAAALASAIELKADVVNLSLGGPSDPLLRRLVEYGLARRMVFVAALPESGAAVGFPSEIPGVVVADSVGRSSPTRNVLHAPGTDVLTLVPHDAYDFVSGSSMAAANVSGSIALLLSRNRKAGDIPGSLAQTATMGQSVNVCLALAGVLAGKQCAPAPPGEHAVAAPARESARSGPDPASPGGT